MRRAVGILVLLSAGLAGLQACDLESEIGQLSSPAVSPPASVASAKLNNWVRPEPMRYFAPVEFNSEIVSLATSTARGAALGDSTSEIVFAGPAGIAADRHGNVFVSDNTLGAVVRIGPDGETLTLVGPAESTGATGRGANREMALADPSSLLVEDGGRLFVADLDRIIVIEPDGDSFVVAGSGKPGFAGDGGPAIEAMFNGNAGMAVDAEGNLLIADRGNRRVRRIDPNGIITTFAGTGESGSTGDGGPAIEAALDRPVDVAVGPDGAVFVAELNGHRVRRIGPDGIITTYAGIGFPGYAGDGGPAVLASLNAPRSVEVDSDGNVYIADWRNRVIRKVTRDGSIITMAGLASEGRLREGRPAFSVALPPPLGLALGPAGHIYVILQGTRKIHVLRPPSETAVDDPCGGAPTAPFRGAVAVADASATIVAGDTELGFGGDGGPISEALFLLPQSFAVGEDGRIFIADTGNHRIRIVSSEGVIETFAGTGEPGYGGNGGPATQAKLSSPKAVHVDGGGIVYFFDSGNFRIRRIDLCGLIETVAGDGRPGSGGDGGPALIASFRDVTGLAFDDDGNMFVADPASNRVRVISKEGFIETFAGTGKAESGGDGGPAKSAFLDGPVDVATFADGSVLIAEQRAGKVRLVDRSGTISTLTGPGPPDAEFEGPVGQVRMQDPASLEVDIDGNVYVAQLTAGLVSRIGVDGNVSIVAGNPAGTGVSGDPATEVAIPAPLVVSLDRNGNLFVLESAGLLWRAGVSDVSPETGA